MNKNYKKMSNEIFEKHIDKLCENLSHFVEHNGIKIDYICPILRSGAIPAVYISNRLNIVKFCQFKLSILHTKMAKTKLK